MQLPDESQPPSTPKRVVVLALPGAYPFELGIPSRIFGAIPGLYDVSTISVDGKPVRSAADFTIDVSHGPELIDTADVVVVSSVSPAFIPLELDAAVSDVISRIPETTQVVSICTGAFILAAAGLLDGHRATTHWQLTELFRQRFPQVQLDPDVLFVDDGRILTSAGAAAGVDACLHLLRRDHGTEIANTVARHCVVPPFRDGGQAQYVEQPLPEMGVIGTAYARTWAMQNLRDQFSIDTLAQVAGMNLRTFSRRFTAEVGTSPGRWLAKQRITQAQRLLETSDLSVEDIAHEVGFATSASLRQHFNEALGITPTQYRHTFGGRPETNALANPS